MIKTRRIAEELYSHHVSTGGRDDEQIIQSLMEFLKRHRLVSFLPRILFHLERIKEKNKALDGVTLATSHEVDKKSIETLLQNLLGEKDQNVESSIEPELIGGFRLKHKGIIYDGSIQKKLDLLEAKLTG